MIRWDLDEIARLMDKHGIRNRKHLGELAGLSLPTTYNVTASGPLTRIDVPTLEGLANALKCEPWALLVYEPDDRR